MHDKGVKSGNDMLLPPWMLPVLMEGLGSNWPGCTTTPTGVVICAGGAAVASTAQGASCMLHRREISSGVLVGVLHKAGSELKASRAVMARRNSGRQNVLPNGAEWVHSDTVGLL